MPPDLFMAAVIDCAPGDGTFMAGSPLKVAPAFVVLISVAARAQEPPAVEPTGATPRPIDPDRPDVTNGTHIVDAGLLQGEIGGLLTRPDSTSNSGGTPVPVRFGLAGWRA